MLKSSFFVLLFGLSVTNLPAQILTTQIGRMRFYNTLDSAKSAWITALSRRCYCLLQITDSTHSIPLRLDLDTEPSSADTAVYKLDYNILSGNFIAPPDSLAILTDSLMESPGIYIKVRDSVIREDTLLRLLDYGIHHYPELKRRKKAGEMDDRTLVTQILTKRPSMKLKRIMAYCQK
jgi:hypothetical protein